jgi:hypothetical protein
MFKILVRDCEWFLFHALISVSWLQMKLSAGQHAIKLVFANTTSSPVIETDVRVDVCVLMCVCVDVAQVTTCRAG